MDGLTEIRKGDELQFLVASLPGKDGRPLLSKEELATELAKAENNKNKELASQYLQKIAASDNNQDPGSTEVRIGSYHIKLKKLIRSVVTSAFFLGLSTVEPTKLTLIAGIEKGLEAVSTVVESLEKLTPTEILLYDVIVEIAAKNRFLSIDPLHPQGTEKDIQDVILARDIDMPRDFKDALIGLLDKKAIKAEPGALNNPIYRPVF